MLGKRILLIALTIIALIPVLLSLINSINQPQVQENLQLYQTNLILQGSEFDWEELEQLSETRQLLIGKDTYRIADKQYEEALKNSKNNLKKLEINADKLSIINPENSTRKNSIQIILYNNKEQLQEQITQQKQAINQLSIKLGILEMQQNNTSKAIEVWNNLLTQENQEYFEDKNQIIAKILIGLWDKKQQVLPNAEAYINNNLDGWFRYKSLKKLYEIQERQANLIELQNKQQEIAYNSIIKLTLVGIIPFILGITGFGILIFLLIQLFLKKEESILLKNKNIPWETPWNLETIWQVLIVGFFFVGQAILPLLFGLIFGLMRLDPNNFSLREKAFYVLSSYISMTFLGILVLYLSIKSFFPLTKDWFNFEWRKNWIAWGVGGYLVA
ncbi:MAG TPA: CPBP family intramembrane metalloprotease domain-containing protein, partial [Cyanothece sp. UBA12306]|nr:CPBP family intramembrane metalloprotease domain-containing protein [Cyanothece sp. UBA12306]